MSNTNIEYSQRQDPFYKKVLSLWVIIYVLLFICTSQFTPRIPFMQKWVIWFGKNFLHLSKLEKIQMTGSGDTTYDDVSVLVILILSVILSIIIAVADRKRKNYQQLYLFTIVLARYFVAFTMLVYGFAKIFEGQFPALGYYSLEKKFGDMSPMGVLWSFMSTSRAYTFFGGLMEVTGGVLLLFRRTKTLGALIALAVMTNVAILNFAYDVPVKIFSTHIVLLCFFILTYEWKKLYNFFILHQATSLNYNRLTVRKKWMLISLKIVKGLLIAFLLFTFLIRPLMNQTNEKVPLEGVYTAEQFVLNNNTLPANPRDTVRWNKMYIAYSSGINVIRKENEFSWYTSKIDSIQKTIVLHKNDDSVTTYAKFKYDLKKDTLYLTGKLGADSLKIVLSRKTRKDYPLLKRGFHWVNEYPYNR
ncbi:MAG TPA: hypothetical protein VIJ75_23330 [Hanamia sp.]